jgi:hypothetical protein
MPIQLVASDLSSKPRLTKVISPRQYLDLATRNICDFNEIKKRINDITKILLPTRIPWGMKLAQLSIQRFFPLERESLKLFCSSHRWLGQVLSDCQEDISRGEQSCEDLGQRTITH